MAHDELPSTSKLPDVHDEAADTPMWVPMLGLGLLALVVLLAVFSALGVTSDEGADGGVADGGVVVEPSAEAAPEGVPAPAPEHAH
jgi:hypothetical protein